MGYISHLKYFSHAGNISANLMTIELQIDALLEKQGRTFYWLSKQTGISHTTLWRLKKGKAVGVNFGTLEKICEALDCQPGDIMKFAAKQSTQAQ
jgi:putative transcriptional regulator